jgi:hypothetical protein
MPTPSTTWITYRLSGRLGNQLQLWACARTLALRYGLRFDPGPIPAGRELPLSRRLPLTRLPLLTRHLLRRRVLMSDHEWDLSGIQDGTMRDGYLAPDTLYVLGWGAHFWRVDRFRSQLIEELVGDHRTAVPPVTDFRHVGVHIRRDDSPYKLSLTYYAEGIRSLQERTGKDPILHVFSDGDPVALGRELAGMIGASEWIPHRESPVKDMLALARLPNMVISLSWFSYWSAFLSHDAAVVTPWDFQYYPHWRPMPRDVSSHGE